MGKNYYIRIFSYIFYFREMTIVEILAHEKITKLRIIWEI
jgi:hypothetical protein